MKITQHPESAVSVRRDLGPNVPFWRLALDQTTVDAESLLRVEYVPRSPSIAASAQVSRVHGRVLMR